MLPLFAPSSFGIRLNVCMKSLGQALHIDSIIDHRFELPSLDKQGAE